MPRSALAVCTWLALLATGCAATRSDSVSYRPDKPEEVRTVAADGDYLLIRTGDGAAGERVVARRELAAGDAVGFARGGGGVVAVAGAERVPLAEGTYRWKEVAPVRGGWDMRLEGIERRWDSRFANAGRAYCDALEPIWGVVAVVGIVVGCGILVYGLCNRHAVGMSFSR